MKAGLWLVTAMLILLAAPAWAADRIFKLTLAGRPVDNSGGVAVMRDGHVYADAIDLTKSFDGFITLKRGGAATITIGPNTGTFTPGSSQATVNDASVALPGAPFMRNGDLFVPLDAFVNRVAAARLLIDAGQNRADIRLRPGRGK